MKRLFVILAASCAILSCDKLEKEKVHMTRLFHAETPAEDTKTYIDSEYGIYWTTDDRISVFCSPTNEQYRFTGKTGACTGTFENLTDPATPTYDRNYAVYPYQADNTSSSEGTINIELPAVQNYEENGFGLGSNTMTSVTEDITGDVLKFRNVCGYLMVKLYGGDRIKSITLRGNNGEKIAGAATITAAYGTDPSIEMGPCATTEITLNCPAEGIPTNESSGNFTQFWLVVPPTTFTKGFTIEITNTDDDVISRSTSKSVTINRNKILKMSPVKVDIQNSRELLSFSLSDGTNTYKAFDISNGYVNVQIPNGTNMTNMTATFDHNGASVTVNDIPQTSGVGTHDFSDFVHPLTYVVSSKAGETQSYIIRMFNLPIVFATTPNGVPITSKTIWTENCTFKIRDTDGTLTDYGSTNLRGRGNASWIRYEKKPYAIKFEKKKQVLGMPEHKRWCLLANEPGMYFSNLVGFELAKRTTSLEWTPSGVQVEMLLNGVHLGIYLLAEQIKVDKNRVDITEMASTDISGDAITGGYLLTYDTSFDEPNKFHSQYFNMPVMFKEPDEDVLVQMQFDYLQNYINNFEASLKDSARFEAREYLDYFDIDSYIDLWFVWEIAGGFRSFGGGSEYWTDFISPRSVYFYKERSSVLKAGPVWDFNRHLFNKQKILCTNCQYYGRLFQSSYFVDRVKEKWPKYKSNIKKQGSIIDYLDSIFHQCKSAIDRDWKMWDWENCSGVPGMENPDEQYIAIKNGIYPKLDFLESYINSLVVDYDTLPGANEDVNSQQDKKDDFNFGF